MTATCECVDGWIELEDDERTVTACPRHRPEVPDRPEPGEACICDHGWLPARINPIWTADGYRRGAAAVRRCPACWPDPEPDDETEADDA